MTDSNSSLDSTRVNRHVGRSWLIDVLCETGTLAWGMMAGVGAGIVWPATLVLSLPVLTSGRWSWRPPGDGRCRCACPPT